MFDKNIFVLDIKKKEYFVCFIQEKTYFCGINTYFYLLNRFCGFLDKL